MNDRVLMSHSSILFNPKWPFLRQIGKGVDLGPFVSLQVQCCVLGRRVYDTICFIDARGGTG